MRMLVAVLLTAFVTPCAAETAAERYGCEFKNLKLSERVGVQGKERVITFVVECKNKPDPVDEDRMIFEYAASHEISIDEYVGVDLNRERTRFEVEAWQFIK